MIAGAPFDTAVSYRPGRQIVGRGGFDVLDISIFNLFDKLKRFFCAISGFLDSSGS